MTDPSEGRPWRALRVEARIEPAVTKILVDHAQSYWQRPLARREEADGRVLWTIDREVVLELRTAARGPSELVVHDFSLLEPLRKAVRTRHVRVRFATARD